MRPLIAALAFVLISAVPAYAQDASSGAAPATPSEGAHTFAPPIPVEVRPPLAAPPEPELSGFDWVARPSGADYQHLYPPRAMRDEVSGRVILDCLVVAEGRLVCSVESEEPAHYGFGDATLRLARNFRAALQTTDGRSTQGGRIHLPINWRLGG